LVIAGFERDFLDFFREVSADGESACGRALRLKGLGVVEVGLAIWVMSGIAPGLCAIVQTVLLIVLNVNGLVWARRMIHDPAGMVIKNIAFLVLVWICGAIAGGQM